MSTNQRSVLLCVNQSEMSITWTQTPPEKHSSPPAGAESWREESGSDCDTHQQTPGDHDHQHQIQNNNHLLTSESSTVAG